MRLPGPSALLPLVILGLLAAFTLWLEQTTRGEAAATTSSPRHDPDFWASQFSLRQYDIQGAIQHTLSAERMVHYPDDDTTEISEPRLSYFFEQQAAAITSRNAWMDKKGEHVRLEGDVHLTSTAPNRAPMEVQTSILYVTPDDEFARTDAPVTITRGKSVIHGTQGMELSNKTRVVVLNGPVTATLFPERRP